MLFCAAKTKRENPPTKKPERTSAWDAPAVASIALTTSFSVSQSFRELARMFWFIAIVSASAASMRGLDGNVANDVQIASTGPAATACLSIDHLAPGGAVQSTITRATALESPAQEASTSARHDLLVLARHFGSDAGGGSVAGAAMLFWVDLVMAFSFFRLFKKVALIAIDAAASTLGAAEVDRLRDGDDAGFGGEPLTASDPHRDLAAGLPVSFGASFGLLPATDHRFLAVGESVGLGLGGPAPDRCMLTRPASATEIFSLAAV